MKGSIDIAEQLKTAIKTAYQHGPMSWAQLKVMIAVIDPVLDSVLSKKFDEIDINRRIFNALFDLSCIQDHPYSEDNTIYKNMQDTILQLFLEQDYVAEFDFDFNRLKTFAQAVSLIRDSIDGNFTSKLQTAINKRTKISV